MMDRTVSASFQAVEDWLRSLGLLHYAQSFYDNGYEDIETCKMMQEEDLNVIDIKIERDRIDILMAVNKLQQNLYFELEPESNENIVERTKIEAVVLKTKLKECLEREKIQLTEPPYYNNIDGSVGDLYPLAIRYAAELATFFDDVLEALTLLRKRQLPQREYDTMSVETPTKVKRDEENRRSLRTSSNPAEYLNCETPEYTKRSNSFSKFDTRVTKSTTDLTKDNVNQPSTSPKNKSKKSKGILSHVFKRGGTTSRSAYGHKATSEFNASELTLTQNEIVDIFEQVKNKEISQEDALNVIKKRGITKSTSYDGSSPSALHKAAQTSNSTPAANPFQQISKEAACIAKNKSKSVKQLPGIKTRCPSAQFYTKEDDMSQSSSSLVSNDSKSSLEISGDHSGSPVEEDSISLSSKNSPEFSKPGIFKKIRNSMRKKNNKTGELELTNGEKDGYFSSETPPDISPSREEIMSFKPGIMNIYPDNKHLSTFSLSTQALETLEPPKPSSFHHVGTSPPQTSVVPPPPSTPPPPPPIEGDSLPDDIEDIESRGRKPSLKIKSFPMNQEEITRRRAEKNNNITKSLNSVLICSQLDSNNSNSSSTDLNLESVNFTEPPELHTELNKITPRIPPRPAPRKSETSEPLPVVPPRRSKIFRAESTERKMDQLVKEMNDITADLDNQLQNVDDEDNKTILEAAELQCSKNSIERSSKERKAPPPTSVKPELPVKATTLGWKKPVPPPRPRTNSSDSIPTFDQSPVNISKQACEGSKLNKKLNIREVVSQKQLISKKLRKEIINLALYPYTSNDGCWCVPYNLVLRYVEELPFSLCEVIQSFEEIRSDENNKLHQIHEPYSENDLGIKNTLDFNASLEDYLIYIGLPMYIEDFQSVGITNVRDINQLDADSLVHIGVFDSKHVSWLLRQVKSLSP